VVAVTGRSATRHGRHSRTVGLFAAAALLTVGLGACTISVTGSAIGDNNAILVAPTTTPDDGSDPGAGATTTTPPPTGITGDLSKQAQETCAQLPKAAAASAFDLPDVTVTADSGSTLAGGIRQIKCVLNSSNGFRANVVVQAYPPAVLGSAAQYYQIMQRQFSSLQKLNGIAGADTAGLFTDNNDGAGPVDEAFAAKKDRTNNSIEVVIAGVADSPGITTKLVTFLTALAAP
jgi:hypothetical protein